MSKKKLPNAIWPAAAAKKEEVVAATAEAPVAKATVSPNDAPEIAAPSSSSRRGAAAKLVERFALWSGAAGLLPIPLVDLAAVGGVQIQMLRRLSEIYDVPFSASLGKALIASLAGTLVPATSGIGAASLLKGVPVVGMIAAGFVMPTLSAGATYAIGTTFIEHFESGGILLDFKPSAYRGFIKAQKEMWSKKSAPK